MGIHVDMSSFGEHSDKIQQANELYGLLRQSEKAFLGRVRHRFAYFSSLLVLQATPHNRDDWRIWVETQVEYSLKVHHHLKIFIYNIIHLLGLQPAPENAIIFQKYWMLPRMPTESFCVPKVAPIRIFDRNWNVVLNTEIE